MSCSVDEDHGYGRQWRWWFWSWSYRWWWWWWWWGSVSRVESTLLARGQDIALQRRATAVHDDHRNVRDNDDHYDISIWEWVKAGSTAPLSASGIHHSNDSKHRHHNSDNQMIVVIMIMVMQTTMLTGDGHDDSFPMMIMWILLWRCYLLLWRCYLLFWNVICCY